MTHPRRRRRICLFGTSANPPTSEGGHVGIVRALLGVDPPFDEVRVVPVHQHMFAAKRGILLKYQDRMEMCRLAFRDLGSRVVVSDAERRAAEWMESSGAPPQRIGTAVLMDYLRQAGEGEGDDRNEEDRNAHYSFCLGADAFCDLLDGKWKRAEDILDAIQGRVVVIPRLGLEVDGNHSLEHRIDEWNKSHIYPNEDGYFTGMRLLDIPSMQPISSSLVRATSDVKKLKDMVPLPVVEYMQQHRLYSFASKEEESND